MVEDCIGTMGESQGTWACECPANPASLVNFLLGPGKDELPTRRVRMRMQGRVGSMGGEVGWMVR